MDWKKLERDVDDVFAFVERVIHKMALLFVIVVGLLVAVISVTAVSVLSVLELYKRLYP